MREREREIKKERERDKERDKETEREMARFRKGPTPLPDKRRALPPDPLLA